MLVVAVLGLALWAVSTVVGDSFEGTPQARSAAPGPSAGRATVSLPPLPAVARMPDEQLRATITDLEDVVEHDPGAAGPAVD